MQTSMELKPHLSHTRRPSTAMPWWPDTPSAERSTPRCPNPSCGRAERAFADAHISHRLRAGLLSGAGAPRMPDGRLVRVAMLMPWVHEELQQCRHWDGAPCEAITSLPPSWPHWLESAGRNAAITDFLLFHEPGRAPRTSAGSTHPLPANVRLVEVTSLQRLYRERLGVNVSLSAAKVKDLKPTAGHVFEEHLPPWKYSHWAFGDVDVVYGDLARFLTPDLLRRDIVTFLGEDACGRACGRPRTICRRWAAPWARRSCRDSGSWVRRAILGEVSLGRLVT